MVGFNGVKSMFVLFCLLFNKFSCFLWCVNTKCDDEINIESSNFR
jgi:hypothetical protein